MFVSKSIKKLYVGDHNRFGMICFNSLQDTQKDLDKVATLGVH